MLSKGQKKKFTEQILRKAGKEKFQEIELMQKVYPDQRRLRMQVAFVILWIVIVLVNFKSESVNFGAKLDLLTNSKITIKK